MLYESLQTLEAVLSCFFFRRGNRLGMMVVMSTRPRRIRAMTHAARLHNTCISSPAYILRSVRFFPPVFQVKFNEIGPEARQAHATILIK